MKITSKEVVLNVCLVVLAVFFTWVTTFHKTEVFNKTELNNLSCGWPLRYLSSGYAENGADPPYPWTDSCFQLVYNEWGDPLDVQWADLIFNVVFYYLLLSESLYVSRKLTRKTEQKK